MEENGAYIVKHTTHSLKSFLKAILRLKDSYLFGLLFHSFMTVKPKNYNRVKLTTIDELRKI